MYEYKLGGPHSHLFLARILHSIAVNDVVYKSFKIQIDMKKNAKQQGVGPNAKTSEAPTFTHIF